MSLPSYVAAEPAQDAAALPRPALVSVVVPAWDEAETIVPLIHGVQSALAALAEKVEVIVVVPSHRDPTAEAARGAGAAVLAQRRPGYGGALREGLRAARGDWVITLDADLSHPPEVLCELMAARHRAEVVIASRYVQGGSAQMPIARSLLSRLLNQVYRRVLAVPVADLSSGFRLYQRRVLDELELVSEKYDVLEEILVKIYSRGWRVLEIPFAYQPRKFGQSHANVVGFTPAFLSTLFELWRMRNSFSSADYDSRAYDSLVLPQRWWQRKRHRIVRSMLGDLYPRLDAGCGSSRIAQSDPRTVALDIEIAMLRFLRRSNPLRICGSTFQLPFRDASFAAVLSSQVIENVPYQRGLFRELHRVLASGGTLVIGTPDYGRVVWRVVERLYRRLRPNAYGAHHITQYTRHRLLEELAESGFAIRGYRYVFAGELIVHCEKCDDADAREPRGPGGPVDPPRELWIGEQP